MKANKTPKVKRWKCPYTTRNVQLSEANVDRLRAIQEYLNNEYEEELREIGKKGASQNDAIDFLMSIAHENDVVDMGEVDNDSIMPLLKCEITSAGFKPVLE